MEIFAHVDNKGRKQTLEAHLEGTAQLAASFAVSELKSAAFYLGRIHDIGKCRPDFQRRLNNEKIRCEHACCGAAEIMKSGGLASYLLAYCAAGHHSGLQNGGAKNDSPDDGTLHAALNKDASDYLPEGERFRRSMPDMKPLINMISDETRDIPECIERSAFFTRYLFSCLTDADFIDTERFCSPDTDRSIKGDFSKALENVDIELAKFKCDTDVRTARKSLQEQAFSACQYGGIHIMNMPTGSGKTLCSIRLALQKAVSEGKKRIIYVIPYTSIIEQTADVFTGIFGDVLPVVQHHSNYCPDEDYSSDITEDKLKKVCENWDAPLIVTTNVQFFQSFYHRKSSRLRKLHNIADSVIVFDEVHMMPVPFLQPCIRAVGYAVKYLGSEAFFLSATMPDFEELFHKYAKGCDYDELIRDKTDFKMFRNSQIRYLGEITWDRLAQMSEGNESTLIIVNSRKSAGKLYEMCSGTDRKVYCLSTYLTANDRSALIAEIRELLKEEKTVTVISTSLIEAGVDLDFGAVYREIAGLDSILQSAGRCNREGTRSDCFTNVFISEDGMPSRGDIGIRANISRQLLESGNDVAEPAVITEYYNRLFESMKDQIAGNTISAGIQSMDSIPFKDYSERFDKMIDGDTIGIVIPCEENRALLESLDSGDRSVLRKLRRYTATVHYNEFRDLLERGVISDSGTCVYRLTVPELYTRDRGLDPNYEVISVL
ncbi:MAG: CRISPR-associated helicase Cas3' [Oscillospiraceae bacterium]|nr:CRISPR-associated helicase Cas3' [Oscillospiraceae bacterium]MDY2863596.1 CRISPR-associated helicase Cas3' [Oscillospiraceae bacterium]